MALVEDALQLSGGRAASASERVSRPGCRGFGSVCGAKTQRRVEVRRGGAVCSRVGQGCGWPLRWSSSERQRASVETTPRGCGSGLWWKDAATGRGTARGGGPLPGGAGLSGGPSPVVEQRAPASECRDHTVEGSRNFRNTSPQLSGNAAFPVRECRWSMPEFPVWQRYSANQRRTRSRALVARFHADLDQLGDPRLWSISDTELADTLASVAALRHRLTELELRVAHHADRLDLGANHGAADTAAWWANQTRQTKRDAKRRLELANAAGPRPRAGPGRDGRRPGLRGPGRGDRQGRRRAPGRAPPRRRKPPDRPGRRARPGRAAPARAPRPRSGRPRDRRRTRAQGPATPGSPRRGSLPVHHRRRRARAVPRPVHPPRPGRGDAQAGGARDQLTQAPPATPAPRRGSGTRSASTSPATRSTGSPRPAASTPPWWSP